METKITDAINCINILDNCVAEDIFLINQDTMSVELSDYTRKKMNIPIDKDIKLEEILRKALNSTKAHQLYEKAKSVRTIRTPKEFDIKNFKFGDETLWVTITYKTEVIDKTRYIVGSIYNISKTGLIDTITSLNKEVRINKFIDSMRYSNGFAMLIGIDNFGVLNDILGIVKCNDILNILSSCIRNNTSKEQGIFRCDGDEILIISDEHTWCNPEELYRRIKSDLLNIIKKKYKIKVTISCGIDSFEDLTPIRYITVKERLKFALHMAKLNGKNRVVFFKEEELKNFDRTQAIERSLEESIENNFKGFELYYQPIWDMKHNRIYGAEALLRWNSEGFGFVYPSEIIPILEESGMIVDVGKWVIKTAMEQVYKWRKINSWIRINTNISCSQLLDDKFEFNTISLLELTDLEGDAIVIEITESTEMDSNINSKETIGNLKKKGFMIALDDFGTGYSNLRYLHDIDVDIIKFDKSFIDRAVQNIHDYNIIKYVTQLAHDENIKVVYEGIETEEQLQRLMTLKPDFIQGYYYGKPQKADEFEKAFLLK